MSRISPDMRARMNRDAAISQEAGEAYDLAKGKKRYEAPRRPQEAVFDLDKETGELVPADGRNMPDNVRQLPQRKNRHEQMVYGVDRQGNIRPEKEVEEEEALYRKLEQFPDDEPLDNVG